MNNNTLSPFLIITSLFSLFNLFLTFALNLFIFSLMFSQFFFIMFINVLIDEFLLNIIFGILVYNSYKAF